MPLANLSKCGCSVLTYDVSQHASATGYQRLSEKELVKAAGQKAGTEFPDPRAFPAPLVLPGDEIAWDPDYPHQTVKEWKTNSHRNIVTKRKNVIYIAAPPSIEADVDFISTWSKPVSQGKNDVSEDSGSEEAKAPDIQIIADYIAAFYHGMPVKLLSKTFQFTAWGDDEGSGKSRFRPKSQSKAQTEAPRYIGLSNSKDCTRITTRPCPDGVFKRQLNLNNILDSIIEMLPADAYSVVLLVNEDIYEDEDDDFCCGRAYGGSRVAVISNARHNPQLETDDGCELRHAWPASHCEQYVQERCAEVEKPRKKKAKTVKGKASSLATSASNDVGYPIRRAVEAYMEMILPRTQEPCDTLNSLWLSRVARTVSHELGHCIGIDHCMYYACAMQSTGSLVEDVRQPPYFCPVDLEKLLQTTGADMKERYEALLKFCRKHASMSMFRAFEAWIEARLEKLGPSIQVTPRPKEVIWISP